VLELAIKHGGTTVSSYKWDPKNHGGFQKYLKVHSRKGESCDICHTKIDKIKVNGRGTYFCKHCQKLINK
jgi:formamidopyrimidine-DNA glycosylase